MSTLNPLYLSTAFVNLFDGDEPPTPPTTPPTPPTPSGTGLEDQNGEPDAPISVDPDAKFTQDHVNKIVQDRLAKSHKKNEEKYKKLEETYQGLLANKALSEDEKTALESQLEDVRRQSRTKEEQAKHERRQLQEEYESQLEQYRKDAVKWETQHKDFLIQTALMDAATEHEAFLPNQIFKIVREWTKLVEAVDESGKPTGDLVVMVDLPDKDVDTGKDIITQRTPSEAVERLKELQGNLFKSNVVSGVGGNSTTGGAAPGANGYVDPSELTTEQWMKVYKEDRTKLGLRPKSRR